MENQIIGRLYYNRNKSISYNLGNPQSTKNQKLFSPMNIKENQIEDELYKTTKNSFINNVTTTHANEVKKNATGLNDFNAFLEKLSNYENKKSFKKN